MVREENSKLYSTLTEIISDKYKFMFEQKDSKGFIIFPDNQTIVLTDHSFGFYCMIKNVALGREINQFLKKHKFYTRLGKVLKRKKDSGYVSFYVYNNVLIQLEKQIKVEERKKER